ncbi:MAG: hypothetical protein UZ21_OP11001000765 [Microgenomates bacterium OLB22]|nr:MAG: hypothetical protein UZ21_OP11001000765 [Microgenomates bacterium OLB22]
MNTLIAMLSLFGLSYQLHAMYLGYARGVWVEVAIAFLFAFLNLSGMLGCAPRAAVLYTTRRTMMARLKGQHVKEDTVCSVKT